MMYIETSAVSGNFIWRFSGMRRWMSDCRVWCLQRFVTVDLYLQQRMLRSAGYTVYVLFQLMLYNSILSQLVTERMCDHTNEGELGEFTRALNMRNECIICTPSHALLVPPRKVMREGISFHLDVGGRVPVGYSLCTLSVSAIYFHSEPACHWAHVRPHKWRGTGWIQKSSEYEKRVHYLYP
jgi:hypothetical protein